MSDRNVSSPAKRILFFDHTAALGGGEIALLRLIENLDRDRYRPVVVLASDGPLHRKLVEAGVETHLFPLSPRVVNARKDTLSAKTLLRLKDIVAALAYARRLARFIRSQRIDLLHTNSLKADILGGFAGRLARKPVVWHVRDRIETDYLPARVVRLFRALCRRLPRFVIANSHATLLTLRLPSTTARASVVYDGVEIDRLLPSMKSSSAPPKIGLVGRISPWKGQRVFLHAAKIVHDSFPDARFQVIGASLFEEEEYESEARRLTASLGLEACVEFTGFRNDVPDLIAGLDILVHASTIPEPFGLVLIEGMAAGKPVVATDGGGIPEVLVDQVTGLLVLMNDAEAMAGAIQRLLADPKAAREMGCKGRERACQHFDVQETARKVEKIYDALFNANNERGEREDRGR